MPDVPLAIAGQMPERELSRSNGGLHHWRCEHPPGHDHYRVAWTSPNANTLIVPSAPTGLGWLSYTSFEQDRS